MMKSTNEYSVNNGKGSRVELGNTDGNKNMILLLIIVAAVCCCGGASDILPVSTPTRRGRRRRRGRSRRSPFSSILYLLFLALFLGGNSTGRNANTNIINVDTARLNDEEVFDL